MVINSWAKCRIVGTWADAEGYKLAGVTKAFLTHRLVVDPDNVMVPAGNYAPGSMELVHEDDSKPSLDFMAPATDDPAVQATPEGGEWALVLTVTFEDGKRESETFYIDQLPADGFVDLSDLPLSEYRGGVVRVPVVGIEGPYGGTEVTDPQVASYLASDTETRQALDARYLRPSDADALYRDKTGAFNIVEFGAVAGEDNTMAVRAAEAAARAAGGTLLIPAGEWRISQPVDVHTDIECLGTIRVDAATTGAIVVRGNLDPITLDPNILTGLVEGSVKIGGLPGVGTLYIWSNEWLLGRSNTATETFYRRSESVAIVQAEGTLATPLANTYADVASIRATFYPPEKPRTIRGLTIIADGDGTHSAGYLQCYMSGVTFDHCSVLNQATGAAQVQGIEIRQGVNIILSGCVVDRFDAEGTGYGIATYNTRGVVFADCRVTRCRHALSGRWNTWTIRGGSYEGGLDDHWTYGLTVDGVTSTVGVGKSHVSVAGRDVRIIGGEFVGGSSLTTIRSDTPELAGVYTVDGATWTPDADAASPWVMGYSSVNLPAYDYGRKVKSPDVAAVRDVTVNATGGTLTIVRNTDPKFSHYYWRSTVVDEVRIGSPASYVGVNAVRDNTVHAGETVQPGIRVTNVDFGSVVGDLVYLANSGDGSHAGGPVIDVVIQDASSVRLKVPEVGCNVRVTGGQVIRWYASTVSAQDPAGRHIVERAWFAGADLRGRFPIDSIGNRWTGAIVSVNLAINDRIKAWTSNLVELGCAGAPTHPEGYRSTGYYR